MLTVIRLISVLFMIAGCVADGPVPIHTNSPSDLCMLVAQEGVLVLDAEWGLALRTTDRLGSTRVRGVVWPHGFAARREHGVVSLIDAQGRVVANEGDTVVLDAGDADPLRPCADIQK